MFGTCRHRFTPRCTAIKQYRFPTVKHQTIDKKQLATNSPMRRSIFHFEKRILAEHGANVKQLKHNSIGVYGDPTDPERSRARPRMAEWIPPTPIRNCSANNCFKRDFKISSIIIINISTNLYSALVWS